MSAGAWQFWIDRGGTFTDIVARRPDGSLTTHKLLSENPEHYPDAALQGIRDLLGIAGDADIPGDRIEAVKMGTTVATNALLERKGDRTVLAITKGFGDQLRIGYQNRPRLFDLEIKLPTQLYEQVVEIDERLAADGTVVRDLDAAAAEAALRAAFDDGIRACAIVLMHAYRHPAHERALAHIARRIGFSQISVSHEVSPLMKIVGRGDTTVVDAYLSPILRRYVDRVAGALGETRLMFMQSNGGLVDAHMFQGKDAILSGPAGGVVGAVRTGAMAGFAQIVGFDMGGTSTDVSLFHGEYERAFETEVAGVRMRAPMMRIHTVAAGGGSILHFDGQRYRVGPDSAGANPGPACYRKGGPLAVTDCNVMLGRIVPEHFPHVFGPGGDAPLDREAVEAGFAALAERIKTEAGDDRSPREVAEGFLRIAVENMANAIKEISIQRGHDVTAYVLNCFGGAGGQHACGVADALGMTRVLVHPFAGVLSAYGMGLADLRVMKEQAVEQPLAAEAMDGITATLDALGTAARDEMLRQGVDNDRVSVTLKLHVRYAGTDTPLIVDSADSAEAIAEAFGAAHRQRFGFAMPERGLVVEAAQAEAVGRNAEVEDPERPLGAGDPPDPIARTDMFCDGESHDAPVYDRTALRPGDAVDGPAVIAEATATTVVEPGWRATLTAREHLLLERVVARPKRVAIGTQADPVMLEVFNNLFMSIAEQTGAVLQNTAYSVNIKERLDFSCALFDADGFLIANAPHIPVHLGAMGESIRTVLRERQPGSDKGAMAPGDVYVLNAPYNGGTHLPDVTVITPVFDEAGEGILFFVASRGHHADIGGITPGSMPPHSTSVEQEGVLIDNVKLVDRGTLLEDEFVALLRSGKHPARNTDQNMADIRAQIAANEKGVQELRKMVAHFGLDVVQAYMRHVQDNAEESVRRVIDRLEEGSFVYPHDAGFEIKVAVRVDKANRRATVDFTGTSDQLPNNFNAPSAICRAAVLYVFRTLVADDIPLNDGCLKPIDIVLPEGSMLNPNYPAAVVAGNVETSQAITNALFGALGVIACSQATMNNFTFGNDRHQYYETICGGAGAGPDFDGASAVHTHMTNTRLTDPEVLEWRHPVRVDLFGIRHGSGGAGRHPGGDGMVRHIRFLEPMTAAILASGRDVAPFGVGGGAPGATGRNWVERADGSRSALHSGRDQVEMGVDDVFVIESPGGGGFGAPDEG